MTLRSWSLAFGLWLLVFGLWPLSFEARPDDKDQSQRPKTEDLSPKA